MLNEFIMPSSEIFTKQHRNTIIISSLIAAVGFFDFAIFLYLSELLLHIFFGDTQHMWLARLQLFGLFAAGYVARPLGGLVIGRYGDVRGRKPALMISLCGLALMTLLMAFLPQYGQVGILAPVLFVIVRVVQSIAIGGIMPSVWVYVTEHLPTRHLGIGCSAIFAGCMSGLLVLMPLVDWLDHTLSYEQMIAYGWRIPFLIGGVLSIALLMKIRTTVTETPIFLESQHSRLSADEDQSMIGALGLSGLDEKQEAVLDRISHNKQQTELPELINTLPLQTPNSDTHSVPPKISGIDQTTVTPMMRLANTVLNFGKSSLSLLRLIISRNMLASIIPATLLISVVVSLLLFTPVLLTQLIDINFALSQEVLWRSNLITIFFMAIGCLLFGFFVDRVNPGLVLTFGSLFLAMVTALLFNHLRAGGDYFLVLFALMGLASGIIGAIPSDIVRLFSVRIRMTSIGIIHNLVVAVIGGFLPFTLGTATMHLSFAPAIFIAILSLMTMFMSFYIYYIPRTDFDLHR